MMENPGKHWSNFSLFTVSGVVLTRNEGFLKGPRQYFQIV